LQPVQQRQCRVIVATLFVTHRASRGLLRRQCRSHRRRQRRNRRRWSGHCERQRFRGRNPHRERRSTSRRENTHEEWRTYSSEHFGEDDSAWWHDRHHNQDAVSFCMYVFAHKLWKLANDRGHERIEHLVTHLQLPHIRMQLPSAVAVVVVVVQVVDRDDENDGRNVSKAWMSWRRDGTWQWRSWWQ